MRLQTGIMAIFCAALGFFCVGCGDSATKSDSVTAPNPIETTGGTKTTPVASANPKELIVSIIPAENNEEGARAFEPMRVLLEKKLGIPVKVLPVVDYAGVIEAMRGKKVDVAWMSPLPYVIAEKEAGAEAFAIQVVAGTGAKYHSLFVVPGDSPAKTLADLKGKRIAFVDPLSTSGGLVPTLIVKKQFGVMPEKFFAKLTYAGGHDAAEMAVKNKAVDGAATDDVTYGKMLKLGKITKESNRIVNTSEPLPGAPMAYRKDLSPEIKQKIQETFVGADKELSAVSGDNTTIKWDKASPSDYALIRDMVETLKLQQDEFLKKK